MLGLNNMRRRKVRTGLTSVTLVLITFVMICFTSISTDLVDVEYQTGKSPWNGILFSKPNFLPLNGSEINSLQQLYGRAVPARGPIPGMKSPPCRLGGWRARKTRGNSVKSSRDTRPLRGST